MPFAKGKSGNPNGRPKGALDGPNRLLREMILQALDRKGGVAYLERVAEEEPVAFCGLLGKVLPTQITGAENGPLVVTWAPPSE